MRKSKWESSPNFRGENKQYLKPPPSVQSSSGVVSSFATYEKTDHGGTQCYCQGISSKGHDPEITKKPNEKPGEMTSEMEKSLYTKLLNTTLTFFRTRKGVSGIYPPKPRHRKCALRPVSFKPSKGFPSASWKDLKRWFHREVPTASGSSRVPAGCFNG